MSAEFCKRCHARMKTDTNYIHKDDITWNDVPFYQYMTVYVLSGICAIPFVFLVGTLAGVCLIN